MIYVLNNGRDYSDETIYFIDVPQVHREAFERLARRICKPLPYRKARVVGVFDVIEWRDQTAARSLDDFMADVPVYFYDCFDDDDGRRYPERGKDESIEDFVERLDAPAAAAPQGKAPA